MDVCTFLQECDPNDQVTLSQQTVKSSKNIYQVFVFHQTHDCRGVPQGCGLGLTVITHIWWLQKDDQHWWRMTLCCMIKDNMFWILCHFNVKNVQKKIFYPLENVPPPHQCIKNDFLRIPDRLPEGIFYSSSMFWVGFLPSWCRSGLLGTLNCLSVWLYLSPGYSWSQQLMQRILL